MHSKSGCVTVVGLLALFVAVVVTADEEPIDQLDLIKNFVDEAVQPYMKSILRLVLEAEVSTDCQVHLAKFGQALRKFEPWSVRMLDASGKGLVGLFQGTLSAPGAYDECIETVLHDNESGEETMRAQYCNVYIKSFGSFINHTRQIAGLTHRRAPAFVDFQNSPDLLGMHLGICMASDCSQEDLQKLANKIGYKVSADINVKNCVTALPVPLDYRQIGALALLCFVTALVVLGTAVDFWRSAFCNKDQLPKTDPKKDAGGVLSRTLLCFSARANTRMLLEVNSDPKSEAYAYRFLHGLRFFSIYGVVLGHAFTVFNQTVPSRLANALYYGDSWWFCIIMSAYLCVDTFLFIGGFLLAYNILSAKEGRIVVSIVALLRRFIRGTMPALFVMILLFLIPTVIDGPRAQEWYTDYKQEFVEEWWPVVFQFRNYIGNQFSHGAPCMGHLWYLSVDYQLFLVVVITLAITRRKTKPMHWLMGVYSVACGLFVAIYIYDTPYTPFVVPMSEKWEIIKRTIFEFYMYTPIHAALYFMGVSTMFLVRRYRETQISSLMCLSFWLISVGGVLVAVLGTHPWSSGNYPREGFKILFAVFQRPLWGVFLMWFTFCCATGRAQMLCSFLSSSIFVPLSRLTFGVYLIHLPLFFVEIIMARDNIFYQMINVINRSFSCMMWSLILAYFLFLLVEAPLGRLEKMLLQSHHRRQPGKVFASGHDNEKNISIQPPISPAENGHANNGFSLHQELPVFTGHSVKL